MICTYMCIYLLICLCACMHVCTSHAYASVYVRVCVHIYHRWLLMHTENFRHTSWKHWEITWLCMRVFVCLCIVSTCMHVQRERERERERIFTWVHSYLKRSPLEGVGLTCFVYTCSVFYQKWHDLVASCGLCERVTRERYSRTNKHTHTVTHTYAEWVCMRERERERGGGVRESEWVGESMWYHFACDVRMHTYTHACIHTYITPHVCVHACKSVCLYQ